MRSTAPRSLGVGVDGDVARNDGVFAAVDSHTEGMPTRVITAGVGVSRPRSVACCWPN